MPNDSTPYGKQKRRRGRMFDVMAVGLWLSGTGGQLRGTQAVREIVAWQMTLAGLTLVACVAVSATVDWIRRDR